MAISVWWLTTAFIAGLSIGFFYFRGLWWTVKHLPAARRPGLFTLGSFFLRLAITLVAFYLVMGGRWERLVVCLLGFIIMRILLVRRFGPVTTAGEGKNRWTSKPSVRTKS